jgi:hypothetical protein
MAVDGVLVPATNDDLQQDGTAYCKHMLRNGRACVLLWSRVLAVTLWVMLLPLATAHSCNAGLNTPQPLPANFMTRMKFATTAVALLDCCCWCYRQCCSKAACWHAYTAARLLLLTLQALLPLPLLLLQMPTPADLASDSDCCLVFIA